MTNIDFEIAEEDALEEQVNLDDLKIPDTLKEAGWRVPEYSELIEPYFEDKYMGIVGYRRNSDNPRMKRDENNISNLKELSLIFYNSVNKNAKKESIPPMLLISGTVALFSTYIDDNFAFCNTLLNN